MREIKVNPHKAMSEEERALFAASLSEIERVSFSDPWSEKSFLESFDNPSVMLVTLSDDQALLAYALYAVLAPEAELLNLAVLPSARRGGVATALFSIPNRYMHTPVEICDLRDAENAAKIIAETILSFKGDETFRPGLD